MTYQHLRRFSSDVWRSSAEHNVIRMRRSGALAALYALHRMETKVITFGEQLFKTTQHSHLSEY